MRCDDCGRFSKDEPGSSWAAIFDHVTPGHVCDLFRCVQCTERLGPVSSNARPASGNMAPYQGVTV